MELKGVEVREGTSFVHMGIAPDTLSIVPQPRILNGNSFYSVE